MGVHARFASGLALGIGLLGAPAGADSFPPGVTYPLKPAEHQPSGLAQPLPSTRRYNLVWKDQLIPDSNTAAESTFVVEHYVGTQKLFQRQIDLYRAMNPNFMMLTYHLSFGLNGADQTSPVGNITGPNTYGQEDTDTFTPYVAANSITRENAYEHYEAPPGVATRVSYPDPYWLMDITSTEWRSYLVATLLAWGAFPTTHSTGIFFDVGFPPWYNYSPATWWSNAAGGGTRQDLDTWWMPLATDYFNALRTALAPSGTNPRYLVIPNPDALIDGTDEPTFLEGTDGVFTENWQNAMPDPGDWNLSVRRICQYVTGADKVWMADVTTAGTDLTQAQREMIIGTYMLIKNGSSYLMLGNGDLTWYPEYEIDLGGFTAEPPTDVEQLRVAGTGGSSGGLYVRDYVAGTVVVNSSTAALTYMVPSAMNQAVWSGGGTIGTDGSLAAETLTYTTAVPAGALSVPAQSVVILQSPGGPPAPGVEPTDGTSADGGAPSDGGSPGCGSTCPDGGGGGQGDGSVGPGGADGGANSASPPSGSSSGCGCHIESTGDDRSGLVAALGAIALVVVRKRRRVSAASPRTATSRRASPP